MILVFKIILVIIICISFMGSIVDADKELQKRMTAICIAAMFALFATFMWL